MTRTTKQPLTAIGAFESLEALSDTARTMTELRYIRFADTPIILELEKFVDMVVGGDWRAKLIQVNKATGDLSAGPACLVDWAEMREKGYYPVDAFLDKSNYEQGDSTDPEWIKRLDELVGKIPEDYYVYSLLISPEKPSS